MIQPSKENFKDDFERYVSKAITLIHAPETRDSIIQTLTGPDPVQKVANATVMIMQRIDSEARKSNLEVQDSVKVLSASKLIQEMVELGEAAQLFDLNKELTELALSVTIQDYLKSEIKAGRMNAQKVKIAMDRDIRNLPPNLRKEAQVAPARLQQIARKYNHGKNMAAFAPDKSKAKPEESSSAPAQAKGMIASAGGV